MRKSIKPLLAFNVRKQLRQEEERNKREARTLRVAFASAIFAALSAVGAFVAAYLAKQQLDEAEKDFRVDERAWLEIDSIKSKLETQKDDKFGATFSYDFYIKNNGKTSAHNVSFKGMRSGISGSIAMGNHADSIAFETDKLLMGQVPSASDLPINNSVPNTIAANTAAAVPIIFHGQEPQNFSKDQWVSYFIGRLDYSDEFGIPHWMKFCFFVARSDGQLWYCAYGNGEDNNNKITR